MKFKRLLAIVMCVILAMCCLVSCKPNEPTPNPNPDDGNKEEPTKDMATIYDMMTDDLVNPIGIDSTSPAFSWKVKSDVIGWTQSAYQIVVREGSSIVWDSGKVRGSKSVNIRYDGEDLLSSTKYQWKVTVWDGASNAIESPTATFETGLLYKDDFDGIQWISYNQNARADTDFTIDFDFIIDSSNQGFCFGMVNSGTFILWQVNTHAESGKVLLRPHFKENGNWTAYPGGPGNVQATDITSIVGSNVLGKTIHERIEVSGKQIKTYFGADESNLTLASTYVHSKDVVLANIGFRHCSENNELEVARYDNLKVVGQNGEIIYESDFSSNQMDFGGADYAVISNGMLKIGTLSNVGEQIYICGSTNANSLPVFRKSFAVESRLESAKLYTSGLGVYESFINGERVGNLLENGEIAYEELKPGFTEMSKRKFYNAYDVSHMLKQNSENVLSSVVASGWWSGRVAASYGQEDAYWAKLILNYSNGMQVIISTDTTWKTAKASAIISADIFDGESYDARVDESWKKVGFDDAVWSNAKINTEFKGELCAWNGAPIIVRKDLEVSVKSVNINDGIAPNTANSSDYGKVNIVRTSANGEFTLNPGETAVVDFGQNFAGWEMFEIQGDNGTTITVRHGEILNDGNGAKSRGNDGPEGSVYNANYRSAKATTKYILKGDGVESYHPSLTFYGFRYAEFKTDKTVTFKKIVGQVVTSVNKDTGTITTSDKDINQLFSNIRWGQYSNYLSVPTDCPQRDERQGWAADTQVFSEAGSYLAFSKSFLEKFMQDMRDSQRSDGAYAGTAPTGCYNGGDWGGTGWADAGIIVPYNLYKMYGDINTIAENWDSMTKYMNYLGTTNRFGGRPVWGDWLAYESNDDYIRQILGVAFYAWDAKMMAEMALVLGKDAESDHYYEVYDIEKSFFISKYVNPDGTMKRGEQTVCLYALYLDLLPDENSYEAVVNQLVSNIQRNGNKLQTGFLGTAIIMPTLTKIGRSDLAYSLLLQHDNPSWLYSVDQGATTIWERWNSYTLDRGFGDVSMNSFNHYAYGSVASWMFKSMAGIGFDDTKTGFQKVVISPHPDERIEFVTASYDSAYGLISVSSHIKDGKFKYTVTLPANVTAEIRLPQGVIKSSVVVNGKQLNDLDIDTDGIRFRKAIDGELVFAAVSGTFEFTATIE